MIPLYRTIARFVFYTLAIILVTWTASLTYSFIGAALPAAAWYVPFLGLVIFDGGMLAWLFTFLHHAEGAAQRAIAILATAIDLIGVGLMVIAEILLGGQTWTAAPEMLGTLAVWGIGIWTVFNVVAIVAYHLLSPEARQQMALQAEKDAIFDAALAMLSKKREANSGRLAGRLSDGMLASLTHELFADQNGDGIPDRLQQGGDIAEGEQGPTPPPYYTPSEDGANFVPAAPYHDRGVELRHAYGRYDAGEHSDHRRPKPKRRVKDDPEDAQDPLEPNPNGRPSSSSTPQT